MLVPLAPPAEVQPAPLLDRIRASLVLVRVPQAGALMDRVGSGVVVAPGVVATNAHVIGPSALPRQSVICQGTAQWPVGWIQMAPGLDLCLLRIPGLPLPPVALSRQLPRVGDAVFAAGFPGGEGPVLTSGHLRAVWYYRTSLLLQADVETHRGSSGGGLFDHQGRLIGLTTFKTGPGSHLSFALDVASVLALEGQPDQGRNPLTPIRAEWADPLMVAAEDPRNWPHWETFAKQWTEADPEDPQAWFSLGLALDQRSQGEDYLGLAREAIKAYRRSLALRPVAQTWQNLGVVLDDLNRFPEAEQAFEEAVRLRPDYGLAWLNLGNTRFNVMRYREAAEAYRRGLLLVPDAGMGWARLALCLKHLQDWEGESSALAIALRYQPLSWDLWLDQGLAALQRGHREEAAAILRRMRADAAASAQAARLSAAMVPPALRRRPRRRRRH